MESVLRIRYLSVIGVAFAALGALLMFAMGGVTTGQAVAAYVGGGSDEAFSADAALTSTVKMVTALDQFLLALFLVIFASGVYSLWIAPERAGHPGRRPTWLTVTSITDLKIQLLEVIAVILAVLFLKLLLEITKAAQLPWTLLVLPVGVVLLAAAVWLIRRSDH